MKILDKSPDGTILKVSEQEIYYLIFAIRHYITESVFANQKMDAENILKVLNEGVYYGEASKDKPRRRYRGDYSQGHGSKT